MLIFLKRSLIGAALVLWILTSDLASADSPPSRQLLTVTDTVWSSLNSQQRDLISARFAVEVTEKGRFAKIVHVQGIDESTPGTTAGSDLGSLYGQAQYIDKSNWQNYSARGQLGAGIVGGLIGAMLDKPARTAHRLVYTLRDASGSVRTIERVSESQIYVAPGLCVDTASFAPVRDDHCQDGWPQEIRSVLGSPLTAQTLTTTGPLAPASLSSAPGAVVEVRPAAAISRDDIVFCRLGPTSNAQTTAQKCLQAGGAIQP